MPTFSRTSNSFAVVIIVMMLIGSFLASTSKCSALRCHSDSQTLAFARNVFIGQGQQQQQLTHSFRNRVVFRRLQGKEMEHDVDDGSKNKINIAPLLEKVINRSIGTLLLGNNNNANNNNNSNEDIDIALSNNNRINTLLQTAMDRAFDTASKLVTYQNTSSSTSPSKSTTMMDSNEKLPMMNQKRSYYSNHPGITPTVLAHLLWKGTILPWEDTVIDATCGNGNDSLAIGEMLFSTRESKTTSSTTKAQLICIDIQEQAVVNTTSLLLSSFKKEFDNDCITIIQSSHESLVAALSSSSSSSNHDWSSVGLICYNLGFLPGSEKTTKTQTTCTISSLVEATLLVRIGGMISVMTYPGSNAEEAISVKMFLLGLALFTSKTSSFSWKDDDDPLNTTSVETKSLVHDALQRTITEGSKAQTWRVFEHASLGRPLSPILITATRIK